MGGGRAFADHAADQVGDQLSQTHAAVAVGSTPAELAKFIEAEQQRWKLVIARAKIKPD